MIRKRTKRITDLALISNQHRRGREERKKKRLGVPIFKSKQDIQDVTTIYIGFGIDIEMKITTNKGSITNHYSMIGKNGLVTMTNTRQ